MTKIRCDVPRRQTTKRLAGMLAAAAALCTIGLPAAAQGFPAKPIKLVVGYSPGGGNDLLARVLAAKLGDSLGQQVLVENRAGEQSIIAAKLVARAAPDGYTLLVAPSGPMSINPAIYSKLPYAPMTDFAPISLIGQFPLVLAVNAALPVKSVTELVAYAKANPQRINYSASAAPFQLAAELFKQQTGTGFVHVPYKGSGDAVNAVAAGDVTMTISDAAVVASGLKTGRVRALAVTSAQRHPTFPDVPTFAEAGLSGMQFLLWTGLVAPAGTPPAAIKRLQEEVAREVALSDVRERFAALGVDAVASSPEEFARLIATDIKRWAEVARSANVKAE